MRMKRARKGLARRAAPLQSPYTLGDSSRLRITSAARRRALFARAISFGRMEVAVERRCMLI
jgi:hypothetical protein